MNPTAEHADLVLPKTTTLEEEEVSFMPSGPTVLFTRAVVPPQGEARSEIDIALPLLDKMARRQAVARNLLPWRSQREFNTYLLDDCGIRIEDLERTGYHQLGAGPPTPRPFATPTGKIELFSTVMEEAGSTCCRPTRRPPASLPQTRPSASRSSSSPATARKLPPPCFAISPGRPRSPGDPPSMHPDTARDWA